MHHATMTNRKRGRRRAWPAVALLAVLATLSGCGGAEQQDELQGKFGAGSVGAEPVPENIVTVSFTTSGGAAYGQGSFDGVYFTATAAPDPAAGLFGALANAGDQIALSVVRIAGRPDTPCRYRAALMARDEGFDIDASGDRSNAAGIEFHQVNLHGHGQFVSLYCATLANNAGVQVAAVNGNAAFRNSRQLHFVLNSIR
ncbi:MAG: hypothetical protein HY342_09385 [Candidatus Lambdaproteobacteria bacterium]|nr:hypothetical protein [Candidatus Lambdaproteobacteria bacterium]